MQRSVGPIGHRDHVISTEELATSIAVKLIATGAEHLAACGIGARADFEKRISAIFVVFDRKAFEKRVAGRARSGGKSVLHRIIMP